MSSEKEEKDISERRDFFKNALTGAAGAAAMVAAVSQLGVPVLNAAQAVDAKPAGEAKPKPKQYVSPVFRNPPPWPVGTDGHLYDNLFSTKLRELSPDPDIIPSPQTYFRGASDMPGAKVNMGWQIYTKPTKVELESHYHGPDEYLFFLGASFPDLVGSFDAEIEFFLGPEYERYVVTKASVLYVPGNLEHNPCEIRRVGKPLFFSALMIAPFYNAIYQTRGYMERQPAKKIG